MADPLSVAASVAGLVSLAGTIAKLAKTMSDRYTEKAAASIQNDIETLDAALAGINGSLGRHGFNGPGEEALKHPVESCTRTLREIERQFRKLDVKGTSIRSMAAKLARPEILREIEKLQKSLEGQKITILMAMQTCSGQNQSDMLQMIFGAINDLRITVDQERVAKGIRNQGGFTTQASLVSDANSRSKSVVHTYPSFEDWLATWTAVDEGQGRQPRTPEPQTELKAIKPSSNLNKSQNVRLIIEGIYEPGKEGTVTKEITTTSDSALCDIILDLDEEARNIGQPQPNAPPECRRICGFTIADNGTRFSPSMPRNTSLVVVADGASCYDVRAGLKINRQERLIDFYNECVRKLLHPASMKSPCVETNQSGIVLSNPEDASRSSIITFQRTLRLPENVDADKSLGFPCPTNVDAHGTSEFLGPFPMFNTEEYRARLPREMGAKGGLFFPIFQREAFAISFADGIQLDSYSLGAEDDEHFAIRIHAGGINCVSMNPYQQDYVICPGQRRLDGYKSTHDEVRQFVAMPLGWEYSAEHQLSGVENIGGLQLQIAIGLRDRVSFRSVFHLWNEEATLEYTSTASEIRLETGAIIVMFDFDPDVKLLSESEYSFDNYTHWQTCQRTHPTLYPEDTSGAHRVSIVRDLLQMNGNEEENSDTSIRLHPVLSLTVHINIETMGAKIHEVVICSPFLSLKSLISRCLHENSIDCGYCDKKSCKANLGQTQRSLRDATVWSIKLPMLESFQMHLRQHYTLENICANLSQPVKKLIISCCSTDYPKLSFASSYGFSAPRPSTDYPTLTFASSYGFGAPRPTSQFLAPSWQMGLGIGARLQQHIYKDKGTQSWDWKNSCVVNIQFLNAVAFKSVTGLPAWTPISLMEYQVKQLTLQVPYGRETVFDLTTNSKIPDLVSISEIDLGLPHSIRTQRRIVSCPQCETNICNILILPCRHLFCSDCMMDGFKECLQCGVGVTDWVVFSAVMQASFAKEAGGTSMRPLSLDEARQQFEIIPGFVNNDKLYGSAENTAAALSSLNLGDQDLFWLNFISSVLKNTEKQSRIRLLKAMAVEKASRGAVYHLEVLLPSLARMNYFEDGYSGLAQLRSLLQASLESMSIVDRNQSSETPRATTCLEAVIDWMESESIEPDHLLDWRTDLRSWLRPQTPQSLTRVVGFLTRGGKPLTDYGFNMERLIATGQKTPDLQIEKILLQDFISHGLDVNCKGANGRTLIWYPLEILSILLDNGALMDIYDNNGNTVLHSMVLQGNKEHLANLLCHEKSRVAVNVRNKDHLTPYHLALGIDEIYTWVGLTDLMRDSGADVNLPIPNGPYRDGLAHSIARWEAALGNTVFSGPSALQRLQTVREALAVPPALSLTHVAAGGIDWTQA